MTALMAFADLPAKMQRDPEIRAQYLPVIPLRIHSDKYVVGGMSGRGYTIRVRPDGTYDHPGCMAYAHGRCAHVIALANYMAQYGL